MSILDNYYWEWKSIRDKIEELEQENRKLKDDNRFLTKISKEYMEKENIIEITEFTELYKDKLKEENRKLKLHIEAKDKAYTDLLKDYEELKEKNKNLKESLDIATKCSSEEEDWIIKLSKENKKLKHKNELQEKALIKLCLKHHYDSIIIEWEEVIDMSNYKIVEKKKPQEEKLF